MQMVGPEIGTSFVAIVQAAAVGMSSWQNLCLLRPTEHSMNDINMPFWLEFTHFMTTSSMIKQHVTKSSLVKVISKWLHEELK